MSTMSKALQHLGDIGTDDDWETPPDTYAEGLALTGIRPTIDVCATEKNRKCVKYITKDQDILKTKITEDWFCNPAYTMVDKVVPYMIRQSIDNKVNGLMLTYAKTDTNWWHDNVENNPNVKPYFIRGRIPFYKNGEQYFYKNKKTGKLVKGVAPYPSVWLVIRGRKG